MSALDWIYRLAQPFVWHPGRALVVSLALALAGFGFRNRGGRALFLGSRCLGSLRASGIPRVAGARGYSG